jgi:hypothetical protein
MAFFLVVDMVLLFYLSQTKAESGEAILPGNLFLWAGFLIAQQVTFSVIRVPKQIGTKKDRQF